MAADGIASLFWEAQRAPGETVLDVGTRRALRTEATFSVRNAVVGTAADGTVTSMLLGYALDAEEPADLSTVTPFLVPITRLEPRAAGTCYINALAVRPEARGRGLGTALLGIASRLAAAAGRERTSLIALSGNIPAMRLYEHAGYTIAAREPVVPHPRLRLAGEWVLMLR